MTFAIFPKPSKTWKTIIQSSKIDGLELYTRYWPWPMWVISWHWFPPIRSGDRYYGQEASEISPNPSCVFFVVHRRTQGGFTVTYVLQWSLMWETPAPGHGTWLPDQWCICRISSYFIIFHIINSYWYIVHDKGKWNLSSTQCMQC